MKNITSLKFTVLLVLALVCNRSFSQLSYYQDMFQGGVTCAGFSPHYYQTAPITGFFTVNVAPGSTIRRAYLICGRLGNAPATNVTLNGIPLTFNATNQASPSFNTLYGGASAVHIINVTALINPAWSSYSLTLPTQASTSNRYQDYFLYIAYDNPALPSVATSVFINTLNAANVMNWGTLTMLNPFNTLSGTVGYSFLGGYECGFSDGERPVINGTSLGTAFGQDINSGQCGGPVGSFGYNTGVLTAMSDDNVNQSVTGPEALSNITALVTNGSNTLTLSHIHQNTGGQDNHPWAAVFVWNSCTQPTITAVASPSNICPGQTTSITAGGANTYTWNPGASTGSVAVFSPTATTIYTVVGTNTAGCTNTKTVSVVVSPNPTVTAIATPTAVCAGMTTTLTAGGASTYTWSTGTISPNTSVSPAVTTIYTVVGTSTAGCINSKTVSVGINPNPIPVVNNPATCLNQPVNFTSTGGTSYAWSGPNGFVSALQNPTIAIAAINMSGAYTVTVTSAVGCTATAVSNVTIFPLPNPNIVSNTPVCTGGNLTLSGSGGATYAWSGPNFFTSVIQNPNIAAVTLAGNGVYSLTVTAGTCSASTTATITINPLPVPVITSNAPVCVGKPLGFTGSGGTSYSWSGPGGFASASQNPTIAVSAVANTGIINLTVTDANGCINSITQNVTVNPLPVVNTTNATVCQNANANLSASGGVSYMWTGPNGFTSTSQNPVITNAPLTASGIYSVFVTDVNSCTNTAIASVAVNPAPVPNITNNGPVCVNSILALQGTGGLTYNWSGPNGYFSTGQTATVNANSTAFSGNYNLTVIDANGCSASTMSPAVINPNPSVAILSSVNQGCPPLCVTFTCVSTTSIQTSNWTMGDGSNNSGTTAQACYASTGVFSVSAGVTDANGCAGSSTQTVGIYPKPVADFNYAPIKPVVNEGPVSFTDATFAANISTWNWYFMNTAQYTSNLQNPTFVYADAGNYVIALVVKSDKGCVDTILKSIVVGEDFGIFLPNSFTPNADGLNDIFFAKGYGITKFEMEVFDRWGEKLFSSNDLNEAWDGTFQNKGVKLLAEGVYTWRVKLTNVFGKSKELTGHVTLIK